MRDRIGVTRQERQRTGEGLKAITGAAQQEQALNRARTATKNVKSEIRQEQFGTGLGAVTAAASDFDFGSVFGGGNDDPFGVGKGQLGINTAAIPQRI